MQWTSDSHRLFAPSFATHSRLLHVWAMQAVHAVVIATCISVVVMTGYYIYTDKQTRTNEVSDNHQAIRSLTHYAYIYSLLIRE